MRKVAGHALRAALTYALVAAVWIVGSGAAIAWLPRPVQAQIEVVKGLGFVLVTAIALYWIVLRWSEKAEEEANQRAGAERMLGQVVESVPIGIVLVNDAGDIRFLNPTARDLLGTDAEMAVGAPFERLLGMRGTADAAVQLGELMSTGVADGMQLGPEGEARAVIARAVPVDPNQPQSGWLVALADVTESHEASERVAQLMAGYRFLSDSVVRMTRVHDKNELMNEVVDSAVDQGGFSAAWAVLRERGDDEYRDVVRVGMGAAMGEVADRLRTRLGEGVLGDMLTRVGDGEVLVRNDIAHHPMDPWSVAASEQGLGSSAVFRISAPSGADGMLVVFASRTGYFDAEQIEILRTLRHEMEFVLDKMILDERRVEAEEQLGFSEQGYRALFDANPQPMMVRDVETKQILAVNDAAVRKYGWTREEFLQMTTFDVRVEQEYHLPATSALRDSDGVLDVGIWTHRDARGRTFPVHVYAHHMVWGDQEAELLMVEEVARME